MAEPRRHPPDAGPLDVVIVGAGLSGINSAQRLARALPDATFAIVEARRAIGGTWDLFRFPGVRSDSDMHTLGLPLSPWRGASAIADGASIRGYLERVAVDEGLVGRITFGTRVRRAAWSSADACWTLTLEPADGAAAPGPPDPADPDRPRDSSGPATATATAPTSLRARFLWLCAGYYRHDRGHWPTFAGQDDFRGPIVHPQHWPADLATAGRRIVVIGSGATAVTLVPALLAPPWSARHVTMLQRSASDVVALPTRDALARALLRRLPPRLAHPLVRWKNALINHASWVVARRAPRHARRWLVAQAARALGSDALAREHFSPAHAPWDQRVCVAPDGDFFAAIRGGGAQVVTARIDRLDADGVRLADGRHLPADVVVAATGLELQVLGGIDVDVDGRRFDPAQAFTYRGAMLTGLPNAANTFGYTNASWTLKSDLIARWVVRLLARMRRRGDAIVVPVAPAPGRPARALVDLTSGYFRRASARLPRQGARDPWRLHQSVLRDTLVLGHGRVAGRGLRFLRRGEPVDPAVPPGGSHAQTARSAADPAPGEGARAAARPG